MKNYLYMYLRFLLNRVMSISTTEAENMINETMIQNNGMPMDNDRIKVESSSIRGNISPES